MSTPRVARRGASFARWRVLARLLLLLCYRKRPGHPPRTTDMMAAVFHDAVSAARRSSFVKFDRFGPPKKAENKSMPKGPEAALRLRGAGCGQSKVASSDARSGPGGPPQPQPQMG